eukprot:1161740-Pelagomonas_calceolata.AAC.2
MADHPCVFIVVLSSFVFLLLPASLTTQQHNFSCRFGPSIFSLSECQGYKKMAVSLQKMEFGNTTHLTAQWLGASILYLCNWPQLKKEKRKLRRQRKLSLHQLRICIGSGEP